MSYKMGVIRQLYQHRFVLRDVLGDVDHFACVEGGGLEEILALHVLDAAVVGPRDSPKAAASFSLKVHTPLQPLPVPEGVCWSTTH